MEEHPHPCGFVEARLDVIRAMLPQAVAALAAMIWSHLLSEVEIQVQVYRTL